MQDIRLIDELEPKNPQSMRERLLDIPMDMDFYSLNRCISFKVPGKADHPRT